MSTKADARRSMMFLRNRDQRQRKSMPVEYGFTCAEIPHPRPAELPRPQEPDTSRRITINLLDYWTKA